MWPDWPSGQIGHLGRLAIPAAIGEKLYGGKLILTSQMSVCVLSCPFALDRAQRIASDAIKRVTFATEDATFAIVLRSRPARVTSSAIKHATFAKGGATFVTVLREPESCPAKVT